MKAWTLGLELNGTGARNCMEMRYASASMHSTENVLHTIMQLIHIYIWFKFNSGYIRKIDLTQHMKAWTLGLELNGTEARNCMEMPYTSASMDSTENVLHTIMQFCLFIWPECATPTGWLLVALQPLHHILTFNCVTVAISAIRPLLISFDVYSPKSPGDGNSVDMIIPLTITRAVRHFTHRPRKTHILRTEIG